MALIKNTAAAATIPATTEVEVDVENVATHQPEEVFTAQETTEVAVVNEGSQELVAPREAKFSSAILQQAANEGFSGLEFDWTSFPTVSLKTEGIFVDIDQVEYGKEFHCKILGSKERYVYRANPVSDNKRDVAFSYDRRVTTSGAFLEDKFKDWEAAGKAVEEKVYLEVMVEMVADGGPYDGEYRILSVAPTSKGRFAACYAKAKVIGGGDPTAPTIRVFTKKVLNVANPFWSWQFEVLKG